MFHFTVPVINFSTCSVVGKVQVGCRTIDSMIAAFKAALRCAEFTTARPFPPSRARQDASACVNERDSLAVVAPRTRNAPEPSALPEKLKGMLDKPGI